MLKLIKREIRHWVTWWSAAVEELIWVPGFYSQPRLQRWDGLYIAQSRVEAGRMREIDREGGKRAGDSWGWVYCTPFKLGIRLGPSRLNNLLLRNTSTLAQGLSSNWPSRSRRIIKAAVYNHQRCTQRYKTSEFSVKRSDWPSTAQMILKRPYAHWNMFIYTILSSEELYFNCLVHYKWYIGITRANRCFMTIINNI